MTDWLRQMEDIQDKGQVELTTVHLYINRT